MINRIVCVPVMLLFILIIHFFDIPYPTVILALPVVYFVYVDGFIGGTVSSLCIFGYILALFLTEGTLSNFGVVTLREVATIGIALALVVVLVGNLKARDMRSIKVREDAVERLAGTNKDLDEAVARAEAASKEKSRFLSRVSHDIRTPINVILGSTNLAISEIDDHEAVEEYLGNIRTAGAFLLGLVNDVLDIAKIESGELSFNPSPYSYKEFTNSIRMMFEPLCREKNVILVTNIDENLPNIYVDKVRFEQIFFNLLSNAVKFTPENGTVAFSIRILSTTDGILTCEFRVSDTGIGMSEEFQRVMFDPFIQETGRELSETKGTGLGLPIVKRIVDALEGTVEVISEQGEGTTFTVILSLPMVEEGNADISTTTEMHDWSVLRNRTVLVAEDYPLNMVIIQKLLEKKGMIVTMAQDGQEALNMFKASEQGYFDIILLDIRMPNMNGFEAAKAIRVLDRPDAKTTPIAAMTADVFDAEIKESIESGMDEYLTKPIDATKLYDTLTELILWES